VKTIAEHAFDWAKCRAELNDFGKLLGSKKDLSERSEIQPFFEKSRQLSAFLGALTVDIGPADRLAFRFPVFGDFEADIVVGDRQQGAYCMIELEDSKPDSIFTRVPGKSTSEWGRRFEHGFSQLVDWFYALDDLKSSQRFARDFGHGHVQFFGILITGRSADLSEGDRNRLKWRSDRVSVNTHKVRCLTFDDVYALLSLRMGVYAAAFGLE
jgi:hypothetical protein